MTLMKLFSWNSFLAVVTFLFGVFICQYTGNRGVFPIDSFSHFDSGYRILNGEHPFKDYWIVSGFFIDYFQSLIFYLLGFSWQTYLLNASILNGFVSLLIYFLFNNLGLNFKLSFFYAICFSILAYPSSGTPFVDHHSALLSIIAIIFIINAIKSNNLYFWFLVPVFLFFAFLSKQVPATYIFIGTIFLIILHLSHQQKKDFIKILSTLFASSLLLIIFFIILLKTNDIDIKLFLTQYFNYPSIIGQERYKSIKYDFKNIFLNFKFIYLALFFLFFSTIEIIKRKGKNFYKDINFKILTICIISFLSLVQHIVLTKNQIFIFFLIPFFLGFANVQLNNINKNYIQYIRIFIIIFCMAATLKYHLRFNIERKFHELNNVQFSQAINSITLNKKFLGLKWITPGTQNKSEIISEIKFLKKVINILKSDKSSKMVLSNYSFFSVLIEENVSGYSRWYPGDNSAFPTKGDEYFENYRDLIISVFQKRKINTIYILPDINEKNLLDYVDSKCFDRHQLEFKIIKYEINNECYDLFVWKKK